MAVSGEDRNRQKADGSRLGKSIVRRTLAGEVDIAKDYAPTDFSADNYDVRRHPRSGKQRARPRADVSNFGHGSVSFGTDGPIVPT